PDAIEKVVYNLVSNALKFTPQGGSVRIRLYTDRGEEEVICIAVRDTGPGIPEGEIGRIFDRFHQAEAGSGSFEGTGLGLALVRELVALHGGAVTVDTEPGFGSEFTISWPTGHRMSAPPQRDAAPGTILSSDQAAASVESVDSETVTASASAPLVLVVDNDADVRAYIRGRLQETYRILEAEDGLDALERVSQERPALVICDVMMPRMDGIDFCARMRRSPEHADIPIVLLTARADDESRLEGLQAGADDYMAKPFSSAELLARVENLIEIRRLVRARTTAGIVEPTEIEVPSVDQTFLDGVKAAVEEHIANSNFGVEWLADEMALSSRQLQRRMKSLTGLSAAGYIRLMRLKRAMQLLERRAGSVSEVAFSVGFRDAAHFSKLFKQTFGMLPSEVPDRELDEDASSSGPERRAEES
ncbi:MAG: response regulator, partial [Rhodothermales bacterium]|nr:response regulator [Rhodothermales bacterium]